MVVLQGSYYVRLAFYMVTRYVFVFFLFVLCWRSVMYVQKLVSPGSDLFVCCLLICLYRGLFAIYDFDTFFVEFLYSISVHHTVIKGGG